MLRWTAHVLVSLPGGSLTNLFLPANVLNREVSYNPYMCIILSICGFRICIHLSLSSMFIHSMFIWLMNCSVYQCRMSSGAPCMYFCNKNVLKNVKKKKIRNLHSHSYPQNLCWKIQSVDISTQSGHTHTQTHARTHARTHTHTHTTTTTTTTTTQQQTNNNNNTTANKQTTTTASLFGGHRH